MTGVCLHDEVSIKWSYLNSLMILKLSILLHDLHEQMELLPSVVNAVEAVKFLCNFKAIAFFKKLRLNLN